MCNDLREKREKEWVNLGGQIMLQEDLDKLRSDIGVREASYLEGSS